MRTRRDQVQAYRFMIRRVVSAMLSGEPEAVERPMRRLGLSMFASTMVAALVLAGAGVWGLVTGQGSELDGDMLVIQGDTHSRYVYLDGVLYPVANLASARLILQSANPEQRDNVPASALQDLPRGDTLGINGAPDALPPPESLLGTPWRVCSVPPDADSREPSTTLVVGGDFPDGVNIGDQGLYVTAGDDRYLLWRERLLRIAHEVAPVTLGVSAVSPAPVGEPLANAIISGPDLDVVRPDDFGEPTDYVINDRTAEAGYIYLTTGQHYVMTHDGLRPLGHMTVALRRTIGFAKIRDITGAEVTAYLDSNEPLEPEGYPRDVPEMHPATGQPVTVCAVYRGGGTGEDESQVTVEIYEQPPAELEPSLALRQTDQDAVAIPDRFHLESGHGALVREASTGGEAAAGDTVYLITDAGMRYPVGGAEAQQALGYGEANPVPVPSHILALIPRGPLLDIEEARRGAEASPPPVDASG